MKAKGLFEYLYDADVGGHIDAHPYRGLGLPWSRVRFYFSIMFGMFTYFAATLTRVVIFLSEKT